MATPPRWLNRTYTLSGNLWRWRTYLAYVNQQIPIRATHRDERLKLRRCCRWEKCVKVNVELIGHSACSWTALSENPTETS